MVEIQTLLENESRRAETVLARVMENVHREEGPRRYWQVPFWWSARSSRGRVIVTVSVAVAVILLAGALVSIMGGTSRLGSPITTSWQSGKSLVTKQAGDARLPRHGTWTLADDVAELRE